MDPSGSHSSESAHPPEAVLSRSSSDVSELSLPSSSEKDESLKLMSLTGGEPIYFDQNVLFASKHKIDVIFDVIHTCSDKFDVLKNVAQGHNFAFDKVNRRDPEAVKQALKVFNDIAKTITQLWRGQTHPEAFSWYQDRCDVSLLTTICNFVFNSSVSKVSDLNNHYTPFSSEVYGETKITQMQKIIDQLKFKDSDVFVDLGSGVGQLVLYVAGGTKVKRAVGIEKASLPAQYAVTMKSEFERWMKWWKKKYRPFELHRGDFLDKEFEHLIKHEATIIFINNYAFTPELETKIKTQLLAELSVGTRVISTKRYATGKKEINSRLLHDVESIMDVEELQTVDCPTSWTDKHVPYYLHTVNHERMAKYFYDRNAGSKQTSRRPSLSSSKGSDNSSNDSREGSLEEVKLDRGASPSKVQRPSQTGTPSSQIPDDDFDDDSKSIGPTTRHRWNQYVSDLETKKRKSADTNPSVPVKWNDEDREYMPPGCKKAKKSSTPRLQTPKVKKPKAPKAPSAAKQRLLITEDARIGMDQLHEMIVKPPKQESVDHGLIPVQLSNLTENIVPKEELSPISIQPSYDQRPTRTICVPVDCMILDPKNPYDNHLILRRRVFDEFVAFTQTQEFRNSIMEDIEKEKIKHMEFLQKQEEYTAAVEQCLSEGTAYLKNRLLELDMGEVQMPSELLQGSKQIVAHHKDLTQRVSSYESEVVMLEASVRQCVGVSFAEKLFADINKLCTTNEIVSTAQTVDAINQMVASAAVDMGVPVPSNKIDLMETDIDKAILSPSATQSAGGGPARRSRQRKGNVQGKLKKPEENSEEMERQIHEIVQAALKVDNAAKEKERRQRSNETRPARRGPANSMPEALVVPLPRTVPFTTIQNRKEDPMGGVHLQQSPPPNSAMVTAAMNQALIQTPPMIAAPQTQTTPVTTPTQVQQIMSGLQ